MRYLVCLLALSLSAATIDKDRIAKITPRLQAFIDGGRLAGAVGFASHNGEPVYHDAVGVLDVETKKPMQRDSIFQIMSMTKPIVGVGVMMLAEEGKLAIGDTVERHLPEFRGQLLVESKTVDGRVMLKKPSRAITIRDLMTHTSGLPYGPPSGAPDLYQRMHLTLGDAVLLMAQTPLDFEPGTKWQYSNNGIAILGRIIEVASGMSFEKYMESRIFTPLGMKDSSFFPPADKIARIAMVHDYSGPVVKRAGGAILGGDPAAYRKGAKYPAPEWALYSTAADLARLYNCLLKGGKPLLSKAGVEVLTANHTGPIEPAGHSWGMAYGLTFTVVRDAAGTLNLQNIGTFGHGGAFGTQVWADPKTGIVGVFMIQTVGGGDGSNASNAFKAMIGASLLD